MHLWDGEQYVAVKSLFKTAEDFANHAIGEYDILYDSPMSRETILNLTTPKVITGYMIHRVTPCPEDDGFDGDWWEYSPTGGKGYSPVWSLNLDDLKDPATGKIPCLKE